MTTQQREMPIFTRTFDLLTWLLPATRGRLCGVNTC